MTTFSPNQAQASPAELDSAQIQLALRKLGVVGSVLYIGAHPDDENTNLLAYLANDVLVRAAYLSLTRGDGGQNLIGAEQGSELGLIRTQELLAARRIDGAEQFFTRARDFGYSKTAEETLRIWGKDAVLADVVWVIRRFRPDIVITRFSPELTDTHGHHTASAQLAVEAFRAAADLARFPEQLKAGVQPWQAQRLFWNRSTWNLKPDEDLSAFLRLDVGQYNPLLGLSYGEMAADSRSMHKSQGFGVARTRGPIVEYFKILGQAPGSPRVASKVLGGIDFSWSRIKGSDAVARLVERAEREFVPAAPYKAIPALLQLNKALDSVHDVNWRETKQAQVRELILACAGLFVEATAADFRAVPGGTVDVTATAINRSPAKFTVREIRFPGSETATSKSALVSLEVKRTIRVPDTTALTTPYWLIAPPKPGLFHVEDPALLGMPEAPPPLVVEFVLAAGTSTLTVRRPITFKWTDPVVGERYRPLEITPPVLIRPVSTVSIFPNGEPRTLGVRLTAAAPSISGTVRPEIPAGWSISPTSAAFALAAKGDEKEILFRIQPGATEKNRQARSVLHFVAEVDAKRFSLGQIRIEHDHIPIETILAKADVQLVTFPLERKGTRIGYVPGPGDEIPASLGQAGYLATVISDPVLADAAASQSAATFANFDAVVTGVRAFNSSARLRAAQPALLAYVQAGGTLVVQYNTNNRLSPLTTPIGPFPLEIGHERVTDEDAPVKFTSPAHSLLSFPNKIAEQDFDGWLQERGLYFASHWDARYQTVISMSDPGEPALPGGILAAQYGKGTFIYTGLAFFRQLPAGVPGAFRLFANLLAGIKEPHAP
ncbi:MAG TPA: PIG-L family deacetylase [Polyangia bacterium]|nr:PIG-L family deacetylase [Polyangia bacterium]